jgi:hypothetical protein
LSEYEVETSDVLTAAGERKRVEFEFDFALGIAKSTLAKLPLPIVSSYPIHVNYVGVCLIIF